MGNLCYGIEFCAKYLSAARLDKYSFSRGKKFFLSTYQLLRGIMIAMLF